MIDDKVGIYEYDAEHLEGGKGFKETDPANFHGSWYSLTKASVENVCLLPIHPQQAAKLMITTRS